MATKRKTAKKAAPKKITKKKVSLSASELTAKREAFCLAYIEVGEASKAYRAAFDAENMSEKTVWQAASRLLADSKVTARVAELRAAAAEQAVVKESRVLEEAARIGLADIRRLFNEKGALKDIHTLDDDIAAAVASVEVEQLFDGRGEDRLQIGFLKKIKLWDKNSALEKLMKHLGMFEKDNKQKERLLVKIKNFAGAIEINGSADD